MTINKKSWHYRLNLTYRNHWEMPRSLCGYFWQTIFSILISIVIAVILLAILSLVIGLGFFIHDEGMKAASLTLWSAAIIVGLCFLIAHLRRKIQEKRESKEYEKEYIEPKKYIATEYIKAVKSKICPLITYK